MIFNLPEIPYYKKYIDKLSPKEQVLHKSLSEIKEEVFKIKNDEMTIEQIILFKLMFNERLSNIETQIFEDALIFYKKTLPQLKKINLSKISDKEVDKLKKYLDIIFNYGIYASNDLHFDFTFRVLIVKEEFTEKGKVRTPKFLTHPTLDLVKKWKVYNRANSFDSIVFYSSSYENVAIRETKPKKGDFIIISVWRNISGKPFNSYPISNSKVNNFGSVKAAKGLEKLTNTYHPLLKKFLNVHIDFLSSEYVKDIDIKSKNKYEYFFSAYFSDKILVPFEKKGDMNNFDCIIYPSIAWKHKHDNIAVAPQSVITKLKIVKATEYKVLETYYEKELRFDEMPVKLEFIRDTYEITDDLIIWEDE